MKTWLYLEPSGLCSFDENWQASYWQQGQQPLLGTVAEAAAALAGQSVHVILPIEAGSWLRSEPWPGRSKPTTQALMFAVEDRLADELDEAHIAVGVADAQSRYPLLVISKESLRAILELLRQVGINAASVRMDAELLPDGEPYAVWWGGRWMLAGVLEARLAVSDADLETLRPRLPDEMCWAGPTQQGETQALLSESGGQSINLLQGEFRHIQSGWHWRPIAISALAIFVLFWGFTQSRSFYLERAAGRLYEQAVQRFQSLYPEQARIVDLSAQLKALQSIPGLESESRMTKLVTLVEQVIGGSGAEVQRIEYRAGPGWTILLSANSFTALESLRERGAKRGLPVKLGNASKDRNRVQAVLTLEDSY
jgi:general secretion pathway protein L